MIKRTIFCIYGVQGWFWLCCIYAGLPRSLGDTEKTNELDDNLDRTLNYDTWVYDDMMYIQIQSDQATDLICLMIRHPKKAASIRKKKGKRTDLTREKHSDEIDTPFRQKKR